MIKILIYIYLLLLIYVCGYGQSIELVSHPTTTTGSSIDIDYFNNSHGERLFTPSQDDQADSTSIHAGIIDFLQQHRTPKWNGYRYWMVHSPFAPSDPVNDAEAENPNIIVSNNGIDWTEPDGILNPLAASPPGLDYNADPTLFYENNTLYCLYRWANDYLYERHSTDGITWTDSLMLYDMTSFPDLIACPQLMKYKGRYWLYGLNDDTIYVHKNDSLLGRYDISAEIDTIIINQSNVLEDYPHYSTYHVSPWHFSIKNVGNKVYMALMYNADNMNGRSLWLCESDDGIIFNQGKYPMISKYYDINTSTTLGDFANDMTWYKPEIIPYLDQGIFKLWYVAAAMRAGDDQYYFQFYTTIKNNTCGLTFTADTNLINSIRTTQLNSGISLSGSYVFGDDAAGDSANINPSPCGINYIEGLGSFSRYNGYIVNSRGGIPATGYSRLEIHNMPENYELIYQYLPATRIIGSDNAPVFCPRYGSGDGYLLSNTGKGPSIHLGLYNGSFTDKRRSTRYFTTDDLVEFKVIAQDNTFTYYVNGAKQFEYTFTVNDFTDQAEMNSILEARKIVWKFPDNSNDKIKNITVRDLD